MRATLKSTMHTSLKRAERILGMVKLGGLSKAEREEVCVRAYSNCREQGYAVTVNGLKTKLMLAFAECRGSDSIVVYVGEPKNFETAGNIPDENVYRNCAHYFSPVPTERAGELAAARFIETAVRKAAVAAREEMEKALADKEAA
jgi:hypothetical protein